MKGLCPGQRRASSNKATLGSNEGALSSHGWRRCGGREGGCRGGEAGRIEPRKLKEHETRGQGTECDGHAGRNRMKK